MCIVYLETSSKYEITLSREGVVTETNSSHNKITILVLSMEYCFLLHKKLSRNEMKIVPFLLLL